MNLGFSTFFVSLISAALFSNPAAADTLLLTTGEAMKGLVVEEHEDRVILSTGDGERVVFRKNISNIEYDNPEYDFLNLGREMEKQGRWGEALSYYEKALEVNPELTEARQASLGVRSKLWAKALDEGPSSEVDKQQAIEDSWRANVNIEEIARVRKEDNDKLLWQRLGVKLARKREWVIVDELQVGGAFQKAGLQKGDELTALDGKSLRYLNEETIVQSLLEPRFANTSLQIGRSVVFAKGKKRPSLKWLGINLRLEYDGLMVDGVKGREGVPQAFKNGDLVVSIDNKKTRYIPLKQAVKMIENASGDKLALEIRRNVSFTRK